MRLTRLGNGLIHRDLKPANLFAGQRGGVWDHLTLLDFGLVKGEIAAAGDSSDRDSVVGTPLYMAPEQSRRGRTSTPVRTSTHWGLSAISSSAASHRLPAIIPCEQ